MKTALLALVLLIPVSALAEDRQSVVRSWTLTKEQRNMMRRIAKFHDDFHVSAKARAFHELDADKKLGPPCLVELIFERQDGLYFGEFISYSVTLDPDASLVSFHFDAGTAYRGYGTFLVNKTEVVKTVTYCGTDGCATEVSVNGKLVHSRQSELLLRKP